MIYSEEYELYRAERDTRTFFRRMQQVRRRAEHWRIVMLDGIDALTRSGERVGGGGSSDPTGSRAVALADNDAKVRRDAAAKLDECETYLGAGLIVIESVRCGLGAKYADVLDIHYMDGLSERDTADVLDISRSTVLRRIAVACDWCDWRGRALFDVDNSVDN